MNYRMMSRSEVAASVFIVTFMVVSFGIMFLLFPRPVNAAINIIILGAWCYTNRSVIRWWVQRLKVWYIARMHGYLEHSLWFDFEGREKIQEVITRLTSEGKNYCDLGQELDLPHYQHYYAISKGLSEMGVLSQHTTTSFYICWGKPFTSRKEAC